MKKSKWIPAVAVAVVLLGIASSCSPSDQAAEMQSSQNVQETIESSEIEIARNYETTTLSVAELETQGYEKCKQKGDW